jgi:hypothetical protein
MPSSGMLRHVTLVGTDVSEECIASIIRAKSQRATNNVSSNCSVLQLLVTTTIVHSSLILSTLMIEANRSP